ncbi:hypothetical protein ACVWZA_004122 [Sphingomonas sp. UYAg733]
MSSRKFARALLVTTALCSGFASSAFAQSVPVRQSIDDNGVDLFRGKINYDGPALSAGQDDKTGLIYRYLNRSGGPGDSLWASIYIDTGMVTVNFGGISDGFTVSGSNYLPTEGNGASLSLSGTVYTYVARDGTLIHFDKTKQRGGSGILDRAFKWSFCLKVASVAAEQEIR